MTGFFLSFIRPSIVLFFAQCITPRPNFPNVKESTLIIYVTDIPSLLKTAESIESTNPAR